MLDSEERRNLAHVCFVDLHFFQKIMMKWEGKVADPLNPHTIIDLTRIDGSIRYRGSVRDIILMIRCEESSSPIEPLLGMRLLIGKEEQQRQMRMDGLMARSVIPRQYYGINLKYDESPPIYYMPFDHTPLDEYYCTGSLNFNRSAPIKLELDLVPGYTYTIDIMCRTFNMIRTQYGMGKLIFPEVFADI
jgi:hypothetical protein